VCRVQILSEGPLRPNWPSKSISARPLSAKLRRVLSLFLSLSLPPSLSLSLSLSFSLSSFLFQEKKGRDDSK